LLGLIEQILEVAQIEKGVIRPEPAVLVRRQAAKRSA